MTHTQTISNLQELRRALDSAEEDKDANDGVCVLPLSDCPYCQYKDAREAYSQAVKAYYARKPLRPSGPFDAELQALKLKRAASKTQAELIGRHHAAKHVQREIDVCNGLTIEPDSGDVS